MNKIVIVLALIALSLGSFSCGGGGAGGPLVPPGENPGIPSVVQLLPSTFIAQTNSSITLNTKVLDGNGIPLANIPVTFTNLSHPFGTLSATVKNTDSSGIATVTLYSTTPGFATILAQVNTGSGQVRDRKSVYFSFLDVLAVSMSLDVDSDQDSNTIYNEPDDFILFQSANDDEVSILATVFDAGGVPVGGGMGVSWSSSHTEAAFIPITATETNVNGQAKAVVKVTPSSIRDTETHVNIMASAGNGAANMVTLFLRPVIVSSVTVSAKPQVVAPNGTSDITAIVMLNTGGKAPDGTAVSFTSTIPTTTTPCGTVDPFAQTTGGVATVKFTAPSVVPLGNICRVTATAGGKEGYVDITIRLAMKVSPTTATICEKDNTCSAVITSVSFTITGGVPQYTVTSDTISVIPDPGILAGNSFTVNSLGDNPIGADTTVTLTITDKSDGLATVTVKVINQAP